MKSIKYLFVFCLLIVLGAASFQSANHRISQRLEKAQVTGSISVDTVTPTDDMAKNILIDDHELPISVEPVVIKKVDKPYVSAESYLVANLETGERYIDHNSSKIYPIASVSKLYTALVVHHLFDLEKEISVTQSMLDSYGDAGHLVFDEKLLPDELLHALLMESSNDAALAFAQSFDLPATSTTKFMEQMNAFAKEIGMHSTHFADPSGLSLKNVSNASDLAVLSRYLYRSEKDILKISRTKIVDLATTTSHGSHHFVNINPFVNSPTFIGGKTGRTDAARETMVSLFNEEIDSIKYPIVIVVLRSDLGQREIDTEKLLGLFRDKVKK